MRTMGQIPRETRCSGIGAVSSILGRFLHALARYLPMMPIWRVWIHRFRGVKIGNQVFIGSDVFIDNAHPERIVIEDLVTIIARSMIIAHSFAPIHLKEVLGKEIPNDQGVRLEQGCLIGAQAIVLPGVTVGKYSIVGAGSVVTRDIPPCSIAFGVPARVVRTFSYDEVKGVH